MTFPAWTMKLAAAAVIPAFIGVGAALSAPSTLHDAGRVVVDEAYEPGMDGIDYAAVMGPEGSKTGKMPACADPQRRGDLRPCLN